MTSQDSTLNPMSIKIRFACRFIRALKKLKRNIPVSPSSRDVLRRSRLVRKAAYASMASAVGTRKAWSRAMLWKIRNRARHRCLRKRNDNPTRTSAAATANPSGVESVLLRAEELRRLVPGGEAMDICNLLGETAHFIKCLRTQVKVMRNIVNHCST